MSDRRWFFLFVGLLLAGCTLLPELPVPEPPVPQQWPGEEVEGEVVPSSLPAWRSYYPHPLLQELIAAALASSRDLRAAAARMEEARAMAGVAEAARWPTIHGEAAQQAVRTPGDLSTTGQESIGHRLDVGLSVPAFEVDFWGSLRSQDLAAQATFLASAESLSALRILLISQVVEQFIHWRELAERLVLAQAVLENRQAVQAIAGQRLQAGVERAQGKWLADVAVEEARSERAELQRQVALAENALQLLTGISVDPQRSWPGLEELSGQADLPVALPAQVMVVRPDVRAAEQRLRAAHARIGVARAAFWPRIVLTSSVGTASQGLSGLFHGGSLAWSFVPRLDLPIFDYARRENELVAVTAQRDVLLAEYEKVVQQAFREVADVLVSRGRWLERLQAMRVAREAQRARLGLLQARFRAGVEGRSVVLSGEQAVQLAEQQTRSAQRQLLVNRVLLYKVLGGGLE
ncbi:MAG: efflux transporter outer membrane subunit [Magnetococcus sp. YQC-3]